jgi:hypothetical protein
MIQSRARTTFTVIYGLTEQRVIAAILCETPPIVDVTFVRDVRYQKRSGFTLTLYGFISPLFEEGFQTEVVVGG